MVYLTRVERFNAAHKLWVSEWSEAENFAVFGKCANKNWHGHNYYLHVTVKGEPNIYTGFVIDAKNLGRIVKEVITDKLDHSNLNLDVDFIPKNRQPTTENMVMLIWEQLEAPIAAEGVQLHAIKLYETETIYAEYFGD
jgi:6-pyruvoyltetrahydropterin/6-carboxytetrahydropterin synthase